MEIYSPVSKDRNLFKKNRFKDDPTYEESVEINIEPKTFFKKAELSRKQDNVLLKARNAITEKLKTIFEFYETD